MDFSADYYPGTGRFRIWLGTYEDSGDRWQHSGQLVEYHRWDSGEPNSPDEKCVAMNNFKWWSDVICTKTFPFICEIN